MIVKGHHFPNVTLVGVIAADGALNIGDYRGGILASLYGDLIYDNKNNEKGLLKGGLIGLSYFSILYIVSSISMQNFEINVYSMIMLVITFICGSIGGIVGINIKSYKK